MSEPATAASNTLGGNSPVVVTSSTVASAAASAVVSATSSILKPRLHAHDLQFISLKMFGKEATDRHVFKSIYSGTNSQLIARSTNTLQILSFDLRRWALQVLFVAYSAFLHHYGVLCSLYAILCAVFFNLLVSVFDLDEAKLSTPLDDPQLSSKDPSLIFRVARYAFRKSLATSRPPGNRTSLHQALSAPLPGSIGIIFDMFPLVVAPPPEVPVPYLNADKQMIVPDKKQVKAVLRERAEWTAAQHTHKATEIMRVATEAARMIVWSALCGVHTLVLHESNGYAWRNLESLVSLVEAELGSVDQEEHGTYNQIRLVDWRSKTVKMVGHHTEGSAARNSNSGLQKGPVPPALSLTPVDPAPLSACPFMGAPSTSLSDTPAINLVVFLTSAESTIDFAGITSTIKASVNGEPTGISNIKFSEPLPPVDLLIKHTSDRILPYSLDGFPLNPMQLDTFKSYVHPANFASFVDAIASYSHDHRAYQRSEMREPPKDLQF